MARFARHREFGKRPPFQSVMSDFKRSDEPVGSLENCQEPKTVNGRSDSVTAKERNAMTAWAILFLVVALVAGFFGFSGMAVASAGVAQILFGLFFLLFVIAFAASISRRDQ
ncbi:DUF1328 domain-containing protein [Pseudaestuariivita atlantica]